LHKSIKSDAAENKNTTMSDSCDERGKEFAVIAIIVRTSSECKTFFIGSAFPDTGTKYTNKKSNQCYMGNSETKI
jgi:hypothetical protein